MRGQTPLIQMLVNDFVARYDVDYDEALNRLYRSDLLKKLGDDKTTLSTWAPQDLLDLYERTEAKPES
jgi:hypothetical protein